MSMTKTQIKLQQGFTMIELMVIMIIITILSATFIPHIFDFEQKRAELVVSEMWSIAEAAQSYDAQEGDFPDRANSCVGAIDELATPTAIFLQGIATDTTAWGLGTVYTTACDSAPTGTTLTVSIGDVHPDWAEFIANQLPNATVTLATPATDPATVTLTVTKLAYVPVLERFLYLSSTSTLLHASATILPNASGTYDAEKTAITNLVDVELFGRTRPEESLQYAVFNQGLKFAAAGAATSTVNKPSCDFDGDGTDDASPTVVVIPSTIATSNGEEIIAWRAHATDTAPTVAIPSPDTWDVWISLITPSSTSTIIGGVTTSEAVTPTAGSTLFYSTKCAPAGSITP